MPKISICVWLLVATAVPAMAQTTRPAPKTTIELLKAENARLLDQVATLKKELAADEKQLADFRKADSEAKSKAVAEAAIKGSTPEIRQAIKDHRLVVGMTIDEANAALAYPRVVNSKYQWAWGPDPSDDWKGKVTSSGAGANAQGFGSNWTDYRWATYSAEFTDGKLVSYDVIPEEPPQRPRIRPMLPNGLGVGTH
jgi:hypothetical protein